MNPSVVLFEWQQLLIHNDNLVYAQNCRIASKIILMISRFDISSKRAQTPRKVMEY